MDNRIAFTHKYFKKDNIDLLRLIQRNKKFNNKKSYLTKEEENFELLKKNFDDLEKKYSQYEHFLSTLVIQNNKIIEDNKFLCEEIRNSKDETNKQTEKIIFFGLKMVSELQQEKKENDNNTKFVFPSIKSRKFSEDFLPIPKKKLSEEISFALKDKEEKNNSTNIFRDDNLNFQNILTKFVNDSPSLISISRKNSDFLFRKSRKNSYALGEVKSRRDSYALGEVDKKTDTTMSFKY